MENNDFTIRIEDFIEGEGGIAYAFYKAVAACKATGARRLTCDGGRYDIDPLYCAERSLCFSNHDKNGPKRILVLIEDMEDFEIDFGGATLACRGVMTPIAILNSKNIKVRNLKLENGTTGFLQLNVTGNNADGSILAEKSAGGENFKLIDGRMYVEYPYLDALFPLHTNIEFNGKTGEIEHGTEDDTLGIPASRLTFIDLGNGEYRIEGGKRMPPVGNYLVFSGTRRLGAGIFCSDSKDVLCEDVTVHSCYGMGFIAQNTDDVTLRRFNTQRTGNQYYTADADATHFVSCGGTVLVEDSVFEGQLDDALNVHGMYTRIVGKGECELLVREMHHQALGIRIYSEGDRIQILKPKPLLPYAEKTVKAVEYINEELIRITTLESTAEIEVGDDVEILNRAPKLIFRNNVVKNNRARGMLIGTRAPALIENCYFHSSGTAIKFESDGELWFESGGTTDVTIRNCKFDNCKHGGWGTAVIECMPRETTVDGRFFHSKITVTDNEFIMCSDVAAYFDNVAHVTFDKNTVTGTGARVICRHVGTENVQKEGLLL